MNKFNWFNIFHVELHWVEQTCGNTPAGFSGDTGHTLQEIKHDN